MNLEHIYIYIPTYSYEPSTLAEYELVVIIVSVTSKDMLWVEFTSFSCENALRWKSETTLDDKAPLIEVDLVPLPAQCLLRTISLYGVTKPQWFK